MINDGKKNRIVNALAFLYVAALSLSRVFSWSSHIVTLIFYGLGFFPLAVAVIWIHWIYFSKRKCFKKTKDEKRETLLKLMIGSYLLVFICFLFVRYLAW